MRRSTIAVIALLVMGAALALAGCSWFESPAKPANDAIKAANTHLEKAASIEASVQAQVQSLDSLPATKAGAKQGLEIIAQLRDQVAAEKTELEAAKTAMDGIAKLEVDPKYKKYATLESAAIDTRITMVDTTLRLFDAMDALYRSLTKASSTVQPQQIQAVIAQVRKELEDLSTQATERAGAAADYYRVNGLGN